jgi:hypothetical protein
MRAGRSTLPKRLRKKARRGFRGYPVATVALYGPDDRFASKVAVAIVAGEDEEPLALERWHSEDVDVRGDPRISDEVLRLIERYEVKSVITTDRIIGCPHEEGVDYEGATCPMCPFWVGRDRWTGKVVH